MKYTYFNNEKYAFFYTILFHFQTNYRKLVFNKTKKKISPLKWCVIYFCTFLEKCSGIWITKICFVEKRVRLVETRLAAAFFSSSLRLHDAALRSKHICSPCTELTRILNYYDIILLCKNIITNKILWSIFGVDMTTIIRQYKKYKRYSMFTDCLCVYFNFWSPCFWFAYF